MKKFAFISRHVPTTEQIDLAIAQEIELVSIGDLDGFTVTAEQVAKHGKFDGVAVVHAGAALRLQFDYEVLLFENGNRAPEGEKPSFVAVSCHLFPEAKGLRNYQRWYQQGNEQNSKLREELESIHQILDNLPRPPARSAPKTEENQWPTTYSLATRLAAWFGSR